MTIKLKNREVAIQMAQAMSGDDIDAQAAAWSAFADSIAESIHKDYEELAGNADDAAMAARGYRVLTSQEKAWYQRLAKALKDDNVSKQSFIDILRSDDVDDLMPETIIEDVMRELAEERPLLKKVRFQYVGYATKWILNDNSTQKGAWGDIDEAIVAEIKGALKVIDITQAKYSAFCIIPLDILDMGPSFLDAFIRATLLEALAYGIEDAIVNGTGVKMPCGLTRNPNSSFNQESGFEVKEKIKVTSFEPEAYGQLCAKMAKTEKGKTRTFTSVSLICNMVDYLTKVMPATTVKAVDGSGYKHDLFPFPTEVIPSTAVKEGEAILCLLNDYTYAVGSSKNGIIEYSDDFKFLDDARTFRVKTHGAGRAYDNTVALVLDISELDPSYITVQVVGGSAAAQAASDKPVA